MTNKLRITNKGGICNDTEVLMNGEKVQGLYKIGVEFEVGKTVKVTMEMYMNESDIEIDGIDYEIVELICKNKE